MNKTRLLWMLIAADVLLAFGSIGSEVFFDWTLPPTLAIYNHSRFSGEWGAWTAFQLLLLPINALFALAAWTGLVLFWRYARKLYVASWSLWILFALVSGPHVTTSVGVVFSELNAVVGGVIIGLVYFSDLARRFERTPVSGVAPADPGLGAHRA